MPLTPNDVIEQQLSESLRVELKRSKLLLDKKTDEICKAVTALANSDGGEIFFGIAEDKNSGSKTLDGGVPDPDRMTEWLDNLLTDNIAPRIVGIVIKSETLSGAHYIYVSIPKSSSAPHQAPDKRFYKRSTEVGSTNTSTVNAEGGSGSGSGGDGPGGSSGGGGRPR